MNYKRKKKLMESSNLKLLFFKSLLKEMKRQRLGKKTISAIHMYDNDLGSKYAMLLII